MLKFRHLHTRHLPGGAVLARPAAHDGKPSTPAGAARESKGERTVLTTFASTRSADMATPQSAATLAQRVRSEPPSAAVVPTPQAQDLQALLQQVVQSQLMGQAPQVMPADPVIRESMMVIELMQYIADHLAEQGPPHHPELLGALADTVRRVTLELNNGRWDECFSALLEQAGPADLTYEQLLPVFHHMVRGPESLPRGCIDAAITSMCHLFKDDVLPVHWQRAMLQAAQSAVGTATFHAIEQCAGAMIEGCLTSVPDFDPRQTALEETLLDAALATCDETTIVPFALVAWVRSASMCAPGAHVAAQVLEAAQRHARLGPLALKQVMAVLSAGVVMQGSPSPDELAQRLRALLVWSIKLPPAHRDGALAGLAGEIARQIPTPIGAPYLQAVLSAIGQLREPIIEAGAERAVARFLRAIVAPLQERRTAGTWSDEPPDAAGSVREEDTASRPASPTAGDESAAGAPSPALALTGLRTVLELETGEPAPLDWELRVMGQALAYAHGGTGVAVATLLPLITGLAQSTIPVAAASLLLHGLASGAGGAGIREEAFAAFVQALAAAEPVRGAILACHVCVAIQATGAAGRALEVPVSLRMALVLQGLPEPVRAGLGLPPGETRLPLPLLLASGLIDGPLEAVCSSDLPRATQRQLLQAAYQVPQLLDDTVMAEQALDCALLAARDLDFALDAAQWLLEQPNRVSDGLMRQLRAALLPGIVAATPSAGGDEARSQRLDRVAALYGALLKARLMDTSTATELRAESRTQDARRSEESRESKKSKAQPATHPRTTAPQAFLLEEVALMRAGPHVSLLAPLAAQLEVMAKRDGGS